MELQHTYPVTATVPGTYDGYTFEELDYMLNGRRELTGEFRPVKKGEHYLALTFDYEPEVRIAVEDFKESSPALIVKKNTKSVLVIEYEIVDVVSNGRTQVTKGTASEYERDAKIGRRNCRIEERPE